MKVSLCWKSREGPLLFCPVVESLLNIHLLIKLGSFPRSISASPVLEKRLRVGMKDGSLRTLQRD